MDKNEVDAVCQYTVICHRTTGVNESQRIKTFKGFRYKLETDNSFSSDITLAKGLSKE